MIDSSLKLHKQGLGSKREQKATTAQKTVLRTFVSRGVTYPYSELLGYGPPAMDLGTSGDVYLDQTLGSLALYGRCSEEWKMWHGPQNRISEDLVVHPSHPNRCLWCSETSFGWFAMTKFAQGKPSAHLTASDALSAVKEAQIGNAEKRRKRKATTEPQGPVHKKMDISSTKSRPIPESTLNTGISAANFSVEADHLFPTLTTISSEISASPRPSLIPTLIGSNSGVSLNPLPPQFRHPVWPFEIPTLTTFNPAIHPVLYRAPHPVEADSTLVRDTQGPYYQVESGRTRPNIWPDKHSRITGSPAALPEQPHKGIKSVEYFHSDSQMIGLHPSSSTIDSGDVALPAEVSVQSSNQLMQSTEPPLPIPNAGQPPQVELPGKAHTFVDSGKQSPTLTTGGHVPVGVSSTLQLTLPSQAHGGFALSGYDQCSFRNPPQQQVDLHAASEQDTQRIKDAHEEIERLKAENEILKNQLRDNVGGRVTHADTLSDRVLPSLGVTDGFPSNAKTSPCPTSNSVPDDPPELDITCAPCFPRIPEASPSSRRTTTSDVGAARVSAAVSYDVITCNPVTTSHPVPQQGATTDDIANSTDSYLIQTARSTHRHVEYGCNNSEQSSQGPILPEAISSRESDVDLLISVGLSIGGGTAISGPPPEFNSNPETFEMAPGSLGGIQELLATVTVAPSVLAEAGDYSLLISQMGNAAVLEGEGDARHHSSDGDISSRTEIENEKLADFQELPLHYPVSRLKEIHISILFADERGSMICRLCLAKSENIFQVYEPGSAQCCQIMQQHCDKQHPDETEMLVNLTEEELSGVRDRLSRYLLDG